ncbi:hypothetical protein [Pontibacter mangrovi]|uniref:Lipoprotein n=1 Tax=Pontibacter mangrovi TaxID=2589816 RepID=A0A501WB90_9BACT|nr:hypothetical protein [Pontibacter mangrovi]TPE44077.1 hypothetical protein FJM65_11710 [Pontibacter mangrovi]
MRKALPLLLLFLLATVSFSCSSSRKGKTLMFDPDGRSMRFENGRPESKNKKWNSTKSLEKQRKKRDKAFRKRKRL